MDKILITSAGSTNAINVIKALRAQKEIDLFLITTDINKLSAGFFLSDKHYVVPSLDNKVFISRIIDICKKENIKIIIPTFSQELLVFSKNKKKLQNLGIKILISDYETFLKTEDKVKTNEYFLKCGIPFPKVYNDAEIKEKRISFPVILKPITSSGSKGIVIVKNYEELHFFRKYIKNSFVQKFIKGTEYTIDGISGLDGVIVGFSPRIRLEVKGGLAVKSITVKDLLVKKYIDKIVKEFKIIGPFNIQCIKQGKKIYFIEINARFPSGGLPLTVKAGLNIPLILVKILMGKKVDNPKIKTDLVMTRYWDSIILKKEGKDYSIYE